MILIEPSSHEIDFYEWEARCSCCKGYWPTETEVEARAWATEHKVRCPVILPIPEHFVRTSDGPRWRGKIRCAYCTASGWPLRDDYWPRHWTHIHGAHCRKRPAS